MFNQCNDWNANAIYKITKKIRRIYFLSGINLVIGSFRWRWRLVSNNDAFIIINMEIKIVRALTCGIIIYIRSENKFLLGHSTGNKHFDIPKGLPEQGESELQAAIRETEEEFGLHFKESDLNKIGKFKLNSGKDIFLFYTTLDSVDIKILQCKSLVYGFLDRDPFPEFDSYGIFTANEVYEKTSKSLSALLKKENILLKIAQK